MKPLDPARVGQLSAEIERVAGLYGWHYSRLGESYMLFGKDGSAYRLFFGEYEDRITVTASLSPKQRDPCLEYDIMAIYV
jgi:hypothetical protein